MTFMNPYGYIILFLLYRIALGVIGRFLYKKVDLSGGFFWGFLLGIIGFLYVVIRVLFRRRELRKSRARQARAEQEALDELQRNSANRTEKENLNPTRAHNHLR